MPPKKRMDVCSICCQAMSPKDETLVCAGRCQQRLHRFCVSVSETHYRTICENHTPFLCHACYREQHEGELNELRSTVETLRTEISLLKDVIRDMQVVAKPNNPTDTQGQSQRWSTVVRSKGRRAPTSSNEQPRKQGKQGSGKQGSKTTPPSKPRGVPRPRQRHSSAPGASNAASRSETTPSYISPYQGTGPKKVCVPGKRRVWGTLQHASADAVKKSIRQLTTVTAGKEVHVKRKFKKTPNGMRWWHVISAEEDTLLRLDSEWNKVSVQTGWKVEPCLAYESSQPFLERT